MPCPWVTWTHKNLSEIPHPLSLVHAYQHKLIAVTLMLGQPSLLAALYYQLKLKLLGMFYRLHACVHPHPKFIC